MSKRIVQDDHFSHSKVFPESLPGQVQHFGLFGDKPGQVGPSCQETPKND